MHPIKTAALVAGLVAASLSAQTNTLVHYPDATLVTTPSGQYPIFTPTSGATCRVQLFVPGTFLDTAVFGTGTKAPRVVRRIGFQIAGQEDYTTFEVRVGVTTQTTLNATFATNLNQPLPQVNLSGTKLLGGLSGTNQVNQWNYYDLSYPFVWSPGQNIVIDVISKSKTAGTYCRTAIGTGVGRVVSTVYTTTTTTGSVSTAGGIKCALDFDLEGSVITGHTGCAGAAGTPVITASGKVADPSVITIGLSGAPKSAACILAGGVIDPISRFGDCVLHTSAEVLVFKTSDSQGAALHAIALAKIPKNLKGFVVHLQWAAADTPKNSPLPFTLSGSAKVILP